MVKFSKELHAQLIPEWKEAFVNYWQLKKQIKRIKYSKIPKQNQHQPNGNNSLFHFLRFTLMNKLSSNSPHDDHTNNIIKLRKKTNKGSGEEIYETELIQLFSEEDEVGVFFLKLDEELNKVNQFYIKAENEFFERGETLNKQLQILLDLKKIIKDRRLKNNFSSKTKTNNTETFPRSPTRDSDYPENFGDSDETNSEISNTEEVIASLERNGVNVVNSSMRTKTKKEKPKMAMRINVPSTNAITAITTMLWEELVNNPSGDFIHKKKIQCAQKMIRSAFVELYRGLGLLKTYSSLNMVAFSKILKKFDKVSCQKASTSYLNEVKRSHFVSSDKVVRLMDEVESIFTKHFTSNNRKKAMSFLRPKQQKDSHVVTFLVGLFTGCFVSLLCVYAILAHLFAIFSPSNESAYMKTVYPVFSVFSLFSLHLFMYGCNLYAWKKTRINYNFIFEFSPKTSLKHRDAFLISATLMTTILGAMVMHLLFRAAGFSTTQMDALPGILILGLIALIICPLDIFYRPTRYCFLCILRNIVCSPFYKVLLVDFFMADQLTSQIPLLRHMSTASCDLLARVSKTYHPETCHSGGIRYTEITYIISFLPYFWRALQCGRQWFDECDVKHLANMGKYLSAIFAAGARVTYNRHSNHVWFGMVIITSVVATTYQLYWDFLKDWGILNPKSRNPWLRDDLILKNKNIYYMSIALNIVLRATWVETIMNFKVGDVQSRLLKFFLAALEVIRRGHWNFYRLENKHLNNVGHYRAVKAVPLPFRESDSD